MLAPLPAERAPYAVMDGDRIANITTTDDPEFAASEGWIGPIPESDQGPAIGWTTPDHGKTWRAPDTP